MSPIPHTVAPHASDAGEQALFHTIRTRRGYAGAMAAIAFHATFFLGHGPLLLSTGSAHAAELRPTLVVLPLQRIGDAVPSIVASRMEDAYRSAIGMDGGLSVVAGVAAQATPGASPAASGAQSSDRGVQAGLEALETGRRLLGEGKAAPAAKSFEKTIGAMQKRVADLEDLDPLVDAQLGLAAARFAQGNTKGAEDILSQALSMRPDVVPAPDLAGPDLQAAIDRQRAAIAASPSGDLEINCNTPDCTVFIDGLAQPPGSAVVSGLAKGLHWVRVAAPDHKPWLARVMAPTAGKTAKLMATLRKGKANTVVMSAGGPASAPASAGGSPEVLSVFVREGSYGAPFLAQASAVARASGASHIVANVTNRVGDRYVVAAYLYSARDNQVAEVASTPVALDASDLSIRLGEHEQTVRQAALTFPRSRVVAVSPPAFYTATSVAVAAAPPTPFTPTPVAPPAVIAPVPVAVGGTPPPPVLPGMPVLTPPPVAPTPVAPPPVFTPPGLPAASNPLAPPALPGFNPVAVSPAPQPTYNPLTPMPNPATQPTYMNPGPAIGDSGDDDPLYKKWWLWTIVGVVVVGGSVAAGLLLTPSESTPDRFSTTVTFE